MRSVLLLGSGLVVGLVGAWLAGRANTTPAQSPAPVTVSDPATALANGPVPTAAGFTQPDPLTLRGERNLYNGYPAKNPDGTVNVVVEIPAGTNAKWEVNGDGAMALELRDGTPRVVKYLPYPGNYGMIPSTKLPKEQGGDGDALDALILGPTLPRATVARVRLIGVLKFLDKGEQDDKVLAVMDDTPLGQVRSVEDLNKTFPEVSTIVQLWFLNYKGPGLMEFKGWGGAAEAAALLERSLTSPGPGK